MMTDVESYIVDTHTHVGQFYDQYYSPTYVSKLMSDVGADYYAVSSTTICEENYPKVLNEIHELIELDGAKVMPVMWITPEGLKGNIAWFLESDIKWRCLKVHPELHPDDWNPEGSQFTEVIDIAKELSLPVLIHTGEKESCYCRKYQKLISSHHDVVFILAHGRPTNDAIRIASSYPNAYVDTAFMPVDVIDTFITKGLSSKLLWGTDMCIPQHFYPNCDLVEYYKTKLQRLSSVCNKEQFEAVTYKNAMTLFAIKE